MNSSFGKIIISQRKKLKINQRDLAGRIIVSPQYLSDIEHDRRTPSNRILESISVELKLPFDYLLVINGRMFRDFPEEIFESNYKPDEVMLAVKAFRRTLRETHGL